MLILVMGRNGSGKSAFAEALAVRLKKARYYIATMLPYGAEGASRVKKHKAQREGLGFTTLELPYAVSGAAVPETAVALVEDVSNLLSNAMFEKNVSEVEVFEDITKLSGRISCTIAVTINEFEDDDYNQETLRYIRALTRLNRRLYTFSDTVVEMREGTPIVRKGALNEFA